MNSKEFKKALDAIVKEKDISEDYILEAMELALEGKFGVLVRINNGKLDSVSLEDVVGRGAEVGAVSSNVRTVNMDHDMVKTARNIGICFGD